MSTRRGFHQQFVEPRSGEQLTEIGRFGRLRRYRCVFCKKLLKDRFEIPSHEAQCDMRLPMRRIWAYDVARHEAWLASGKI